MQTEKLSIRLPLDMARMVRRQVEEGGYASDSEVIRDALHLWQERGDARGAEARGERLDAIRASLDEAAADPVRIGADEVRAHFDRLLARD